MKRRFKLQSFFLILALTLAVAVPAGIVQDQPQEGQEKTEKEQTQKKKKRGGFFSGLKAITGESSEQQEVTATAGSKTIGEGEQIGDAKPTAADRQAVTAMENYPLPQNDLKKFQEDGRLKPNQ